MDRQVAPLIIKGFDEELTGFETLHRLVGAELVNLHGDLSTACLSLFSRRLHPADLLMSSIAAHRDLALRVVEIFMIPHLIQIVLGRAL
eukprot:1094259-Prorocentrum_minimum.AAC.4